MKEKKGMLVPCAVRFSAVSSHDIHDIHERHDILSGRVSPEEEEDSVGGLTVKNFKPDSRLNPLSVEGLTQKSVFGGEDGEGKIPGDEEIFNKAKALVMAKLVTGAADHSDTRRPIDSFDHFDPKTGQTSKAHIEYVNIKKGGIVTALQKAVLVNERGEKVDLRVSDVASLYPRFYPGGPESGETPSGVAALVSGESTGHHKIDVDAKVVSTDVLDTVAEKLLDVGDSNKPLIETFLLDKKSQPIKALNKFLLDEIKGYTIAVGDDTFLNTIKFRPIIHIDLTGNDRHNFVLMDTMLYEHSRKPDFEHHNVGERLGRNLTPILLSPEVLVFRDDFMSGKIPEMVGTYIVMVKKAGSWKVGRFTNAQEVDDWMNTMN